LSRRDQLYTWILQRGLEAICRAAEKGESDWCRAEADHIHNVPALIGNLDEQKHVYYLATERTDYVEWVQTVKRPEVYEFVKNSYMPTWKELEKLAGWDELLARGDCTRPKPSH